MPKNPILEVKIDSRSGLPETLSLGPAEYSLARLSVILGQFMSGGAAAPSRGQFLTELTTLMKELIAAVDEMEEDLTDLTGQVDELDGVPQCQAEEFAEAIQEILDFTPDDGLLRRRMVALREALLRELRKPDAAPWIEARLLVECALLLSPREK